MSRQFAALLATSALAIIPQLVWAQAPTAPSAPATSAPPAAQQSAETVIPEIVVTAQRRSESAQKAAVAIAVVSNTALVDKGVATPAQLSQLVPSVSIQSAGGSATTFFVRGVGNFAVNGYTDPAIGFNYDGVYLGRATENQGLIYDLDRIEVLKGPQGTLYGRNATSGAINVLPAQPQLGKFGGFLTGSYGNYNAVQVQGAVNLPLGDTTALRVSGLRSSHDGYLSDGTSDQDLTAVRAQIKSAPSDALTVRVGADYAHAGGKGGGSVYADRGAYNAALGQYVWTPAGFGSNVGLFDPAAQAYRTRVFSPISGRTLPALDQPPYQNNESYGVEGEIDWKSPVGSFTIIPAFRGARLSEIFTVPAFEAYMREKDSQSSVEARYSRDRIANIFDVIVGGIYYHESVNANYQFNQQSLAPFTALTDFTESKAAFGRVTAHVTDRFRIVGGLRYTDDYKHFDGQANNVQVVCTVRVAGVPSCPTAPQIPTVASISQVGFATVPNATVPIPGTGAVAKSTVTAVNTPLAANNLNEHIGIEYDLGAQSLAYATYENGFRSGGFSLSAGHTTYQPEYIDAYTVGLKNRLLDNRLLLNIEGFVWKYRDQQVTHAGLDINGVQGNFTENVGRSTNAGAELEAQYAVTSDLRLSVDVQYLHARYDSFVYQVPVGNAPPAVGCPYAVSAANAAYYSINCSGKPAYNSPEWTINLGAQQTFHLSGALVTLSADTQYKSQRYVAFEYLPFESIGPNWVSNAAISVMPLGSPITVSAYVQNIEGRRIPVASNGVAFANLYTYNVTEPRTYGVRLTAKF